MDKKTLVEEMIVAKRQELAQTMSPQQTLDDYICDLIVMDEKELDGLLVEHAIAAKARVVAAQGALEAQKLETEAALTQKAIGYDSIVAALQEKK